MAKNEKTSNEMLSKRLATFEAMWFYHKFFGNTMFKHSLSTSMVFMSLLSPGCSLATREKAPEQNTTQARQTPTPAPSPSELDLLFPSKYPNILKDSSSEKQISFETSDRGMSVKKFYVKALKEAGFSIRQDFMLTTAGAKYYTLEAYRPADIQIRYFQLLAREYSNSDAVSQEARGKTLVTGEWTTTPLRKGN